MQYRVDQRSGNKLSVLGFGCMRLPRGVGGTDLKKTEQIIMQAIDKGVNYFDTAYLYAGSEQALGGVLAKNKVRDKVFIATKLPIANCKSGADFDRFFNRQLESLQTDYVDYYLMHNVNNLEQWQQLCGWGIEDWIKRQKFGGRLRQVGFSFHGAREEFLKTLDSYDWDFCQIQYNYADESFQAGVTGLRRAAEKNIPVIIMEPLLGGKLANGLPKQAAEVFHRADPSLTPAAWGLRWLWNQPEVTVVLSGMNDGAQVEQNLQTACDSSPGMLSEREAEAYRRVVEIFKATDKVPCTGCEYCMPCPQGVNIPACFASYNASYSMGRVTGMILYTTSTAANRDKRGTASLCIQCGKCEQHCPQSIGIRSSLNEVERRMEPFWYNWAMAYMRGRAR